jgi:hypothetical protein
MELSGEVRDRSVGAAELLQHAAPGRVRQRGERSIETGLVMLNHMVQYIAERLAACQEETKALGGMTLRAPLAPRSCLCTYAHASHELVRLGKDSLTPWDLSLGASSESCGWGRG